jgi:hypothetical protein
MRLYWFILGVAMGISHDAWCLPVGLLMSPKQVWSWCLVAQQPSCVLTVMWWGEALYGIEVQGVEVLILLDALFLPSVAPASQQDFWFTVYFCTLVAMLDQSLLPISLTKSSIFLFLLLLAFEPQASHTLGPLSVQRLQKSAMAGACHKALLTWCLKWDLTTTLCPLSLPPM